MRTHTIASLFLVGILAAGLGPLAAGDGGFGMLVT